VIVIPLRLKALAAAGVLAGGLGAAAMSGAFAAPSPNTFSAAVAASPTATGAAGSQTKPPGPRGRWQGGAGMMSSLAQFLGISATELQTDLRNGQTLAQIAQAHGKSTSDLKTFLTNQLKTRLDKAVASGRMTSQQETTALNNASSRFDNLINSKLPAPGQRGPRGFGGPGIGRPGFGGPYLSTVAQTLGMQPADVRTELQNGKTLAQIAQEHGKTSADLENAILASIKTRLDKLMTTNFQQLAQQRRAARQGQAPSSTATPTP